MRFGASPCQPRGIRAATPARREALATTVSKFVFWRLSFVGGTTPCRYTSNVVVGAEGRTKQVSASSAATPSMHQSVWTSGAGLAGHAVRAAAAEAAVGGALGAGVGAETEGALVALGAGSACGERGVPSAHVAHAMHAK